MKYLAVFFLMLLGYTFIYAGVSKFWTGVTYAIQGSTAAGQ